MARHILLRFPLAAWLHLLLLFPLLPLASAEYDTRDLDAARVDFSRFPMYECHASRLAPLGAFWSPIIMDTDKKTCRNNICSMLWGLTRDGRVRILAQGCSKGGLDAMHNGARRPNECPNSVTVGSPSGELILNGTEGAAILATVRHVRLCLCQAAWCNAPPVADGEECARGSQPFCTPADSKNVRARPFNYSLPGGARQRKMKDAYYDGDYDDYYDDESDEAKAAEGKTKQRTSVWKFIPPPGGYFTSAVAPSQGEERERGAEAPPPDPNLGQSDGGFKRWWPVYLGLVTISIALGVLLYALARKMGWVGKPSSQDSIQLLAPKRHSVRYHHTSSRLNSVTQITILTEVAQGYRPEAEDMVRESAAGGPHLIANWQYGEENKLGTGSFGTVYRVEMRPDYLIDAKRAALKVFDHRRSTHFFNESRTLKYVHDFKNHPNIVQYLGRAVECRDTLDEATWRIALELCDGGALRDWITGTHITLVQYVEAAAGLLSALTYLHSEMSVPTNFLSSVRGSSSDSCNVEAGPSSSSSSRARRSSKSPASTTAPMKRKFRIAHCDINSRNILVKNPITGEVVLSDFGLALTDREKRQEEVQIREIGTIRYLAPEMLQSLINLSDTLNSLILVDTYATGLVLWEMLSRTAEMYADDSLIPAYSPPYEQELEELSRGEAVVNRFEAMLNVVVRREQRPSWAGQRRAEWRAQEDKDVADDKESSLNEEERFLLASAEGVDAMLARDPDARMTIPAMGEKVDKMRLRLRRERQERRGAGVSREDSLLDETSASN